MLLLGVFLSFGTTRAQDFEVLETVVREGKVVILEESVKKNASLLEYSNTKGYSLLMIAVYNKQLPMVEYLLSQKVDVNGMDNSGNTALMGAAFQGYKEIAALLLCNNAAIDQQNYNGATALHFAATFDQREVVQLLLEAGANKEVKNNFGDTAYATALKQGNKSTSKLLETR